MTDKLDYTSVASGRGLVLAVVNSSDWDTDGHMQSYNGLDKEIRNEETLQQCMRHNSWQLAWHSEGHIGRVDTVGRLQQWSGHPVSQLKLHMYNDLAWATNCFMGLKNFVVVIRAGGRDDSHLKGVGMLVVSLRGVNFWIFVSCRVFWGKHHYF